MDETALRATLLRVLQRAEPAASALGYRLVGTAAALIQGVPLPAGDVDVLVARRAGVDMFATALAEFPCLAAPSRLAGARQYFARFDVGGVEVEVSTVEWPVDADTSECAGPGPWKHYADVAIGPYAVPAVRLELRLVSELVRDRPGRYGPLIDHLRRHGGDIGLVHRAMQDRGVDPMLHQRVIDQLRR